MQETFSASLSPPADGLTSGFQHSRKSLAIDPKRVLDLAIVTISLILMLPLLITIAAIVFAIEGRPILIRHKRVGRDGKIFECLKFRTMNKNSDAILSSFLASSPSARLEWEATRKLKSDPRVTPLGQVLRRSSADEIPQLINILRGDMSLVGPRPIVPAEAVHYGACYELYQKVRPGLTGAWQISGRNNLSYAARVEIDKDYVQNRTFARDLTILAKTIPAVLSARGCY